MNALSSFTAKAALLTTVWLPLGYIQAQNAAPPAPVATSIPAKDTPLVSAPWPAVQRARMDAHIQRLMRQQHVPGVSVGVVQDGQITFMRAYGWRDAPRRLPMTPETLMAIGSMSKSFTGVLSVMLAQDGVLDLDRPIRAWMPEFKLQDRNAAEHLTLRDLLTHQSGLPGHQLALNGERFAHRDQLLQSLAQLAPTARLREKFQYQNLMYMLASHLQASAAHQTWEDLVRQRIFEPVGMTASTALLQEALAQPNVARGHSWQGGQTWSTPAPLDGRMALGAGAIYANLPDMLRYVQWRMDGYRVQGQPLLTTTAMAEVDRPQVPMEPHIHYGLGLQFGEHRGHPLVFHSGGIDRFSAHMAWLPEQRVGVVVLTNAYEPLAQPLARWLLDTSLGLPWPRAQEEAQALTLPPLPPEPQANGPHAAAAWPLKAYVGRYSHPGYGPAHIRLVRGRLQLVFGPHTAALRPLGGDRFATVVQHQSRTEQLIDMLARLTLAFGPADAPAVERFSVRLDPEAPPVTFERVLR